MPTKDLFNDSKALFTNNNYTHFKNIKRKVKKKTKKKTVRTQMQTEGREQ